MKISSVREYTGAVGMDGTLSLKYMFGMYCMKRQTTLKWPRLDTILGCCESGNEPLCFLKICFI
jgi:hypothetical protein